MLGSSRFTKDSITVERSTVSRGSDGAEKTGTETVLSCDGDAQALDIRAEELPGVFDDGGLQFFAAESTRPVRPGDDATVETEEGDTYEATVESVVPDDASLLLSYESPT
jgi:hypothetical protein